MFDPCSYSRDFPHIHYGYNPNSGEDDMKDKIKQAKQTMMNLIERMYKPLWIESKFEHNTRRYYYWLIVCIKKILSDRVKSLQILQDIDNTSGWVGITQRKEQYKETQQITGFNKLTKYDGLESHKNKVLCYR